VVPKNLRQLNGICDETRDHHSQNRDKWERRLTE
jgi:hypothetical protein